jgi:hypothetical protein
LVSRHEHGDLGDPMTVFIVPTPDGSTPFADQRTALDGREYVLAFAWNGREGSWYLSISDESGEPISTVKILPNTPLFRRVKDARKPPGFLVALSGDDTPPTLADLGTRVVLYYYDAAELLLGNTAPVTVTPYEGSTAPLGWLMIDGDFLVIGDSLLYV